MRLSRCLALLVPLCFASSAFALEPSYYLFTYKPGASWNQRLSYLAQKGLTDHHLYLTELHANDVVVMGGEVDDEVDQAVAVYLVRAGSLDDAEKIAELDPGVQTKLVRVSVLPWQVSLSSIRIVKRRQPSAVNDPDETFTIKRLDPNSSLNQEN